MVSKHKYNIFDTGYCGASYGTSSISCDPLELGLSISIGALSIDVDVIAVGLYGGGATDAADIEPRGLRRFSGSNIPQSGMLNDTAKYNQ